HEDLTNLEDEYLEERDAIRKELELAIDRRYKELEDEAVIAEAEGVDTKKLKRDAEREIEGLRERYDNELDLLSRTWDEFKGLHSRKIIDDDMLWRELTDRYGDYFEGGKGADAIKQLIDRIDFDEEEQKLREAIDPGDSGRKPLSAQRRQKAIKRLKIVASFNRRDEHGRRTNDPKAMILDVVPVIPPELRPMVQLDGGRFATSDLNDLYQAPDIIKENEMRMLQEAVDALFDNGRRGRPVTGPGNRPLKSLSDMLKGKQGRFRQNLLGKRVDYSGRSVIVAGPTLRLHQCGLPKLMALELFKPFVMKRLVDLDLAQNIKTAKRMVERRRPQVWDVLDDVIKEHPVLLNRAPTLHRLGIQAFEPVLVEGKAIQIHPLVCTAFNADFDGDQMAIHVPLSAEAQAEARVLMLSANNILSPASGRPIVAPTQDMVIGGFYLTEHVEGAKGEGRVFRHLWEVLRAYDEGSLDLHARITVRPVGGAPFESTAGRALFEEALPADYAEQFGHVDTPLRKKELGIIVERLSDHYSTAEVARSLDAIKNLCYRFASQSGLTVSIDDVKTPKAKRSLLDGYEEQADKVENQFRRGIITDGERRQQEVRIWTDATKEVQDAMEAEFKAQRFNPIDMMVGSGARGNMTQMRQIAGMRGLVANPRGDMIPRPIKSNFREGLETLEYFIATPGARKGLVDTALRTADSGYLTRRLVDVAQELIIREHDCGTNLGVWVEDVAPDTANTRSYLETKLFGRALLQDVTLSDGTVLERNTLVGDEEMALLRDDPAIDRLRVRSVLTCDARFGVCAICYGRSLATGEEIELGEAVGVIAAQSIGEPGTQLTMRTFHTGGVAGKDIAGGLPRVVELFEARTPKGSARLAKASGALRLGEDEGKGIKV
ncbi:MAG: DNA-directed RNA polymerase subunit beta', partial [Nocardiopsis sp. BM-2018]